MEEEYELQEIQTPDVFANRKARYVLLAISLICIIILSIRAGIESKSIGIMLILLFGYICMLGIIALAIYLFPKNNKQYKYIKDIGKKDTAYIVGTGYSRHRGFLRGFYKLYYITIAYQEKVKNIYKLQNNTAYKILKQIFDLDSNKYPVAKVVKIPVDIYVYKNKIYVDFESVKLSTLDGYEEAKKTITEMHKSSPYSI